MNDEQKAGLKGLDKKTVIVFVLVGVAIIMSLIISFFFNSTKQTNEAELDDDGAHNEEMIEGGVFLSFENEYQLEYAFGKKTSERILAEINRMISGMTNNSGQSGVEFKGVIEETSLKKDDVDYGYGYNFIIDVTDGNKYQIWARTGGTYGFVYDCILIQQIDSGSGDGYMNIILEEVDSEDARRDQLINELVDWSKKKLPSLNIVLNVIDR